MNGRSRTKPVLFTPISEEKVNTHFDAHIAGISEMAQAYEKKLKNSWHEAPEKHLIIFMDEDEVDRGSKRKMEIGLEAHKKRLATLNKMKNNKNITKEEHNLLLAMPKLARDPRITQYEHISQEYEQKKSPSNKK